MKLFYKARLFPKSLILIAMVLIISSTGLNSQSNIDFKPLLYQAIEDNNLITAILAISTGDVNEVYDRDTMLCWAIRKQRTDIIISMLESPKINVNKMGFWYDDQDEWERPPLIIAAHMGQHDIVKLLIEKGANLNARDSVNGAPYKSGDTALLKAAKRDHIEVVEVFAAYVKKLGVDLQDKLGQTALWYGSENESFEMVKLIHSMGGKINIPNNSGKSILTTTILHKSYDILDFLVSKGADINMIDYGGHTTLIEAISMRHDKNYDIVYRYIEKFMTFKPNVNITKLFQNGGGYSALHRAARYGFVDTIKLLLDNGAIINIKSLATGGTPLHTAASIKSYNAATYLVERGADLEVADFSGDTPLFTAVKVFDPDMVKTLVKLGSKINVQSKVNVLTTPLNIAIMNLDPFNHRKAINIMKTLLDNNADVNFSSSNGNTPLITASYNSDMIQSIEKVKLLLTKGPNLNLVNDKGETALMLAAGKGNTTVVKLLLDKGADVSIRNGAGETAMSYAERSGKNAIIKHLTTKGLQPDEEIVFKKVIVEALVGTWQGFQDGLPQALFTITLNRNNTFDFNSRLTQEELKKYPAGSMNPIIAAHKGDYTFNNDIMIWYPENEAPNSMRWKLENNMLIIDQKIRLKKVK